MSESMRPAGKTTVDPDVLVTIARLSALRIDGVSRMATAPRPVNRLFSGFVQDGIRFQEQDGSIFIDLYVILKGDAPVKDTATMIRSEVARAITELVGLDVGWVNVHVEDVDFNAQGQE
jgi:uncharacterized alkaline shock family protein YloU